MSMARRVTVGRTYRYDPVLFDMIYKPHVGQGGETAVKGDIIVKVIDLKRCPPANTMGMCYIERVSDGKFCGMAMTNSLQPIKSLRETMEAVDGE